MTGPDTSPIGLAGRIVLATRGAAGPGEVELHIRGGTEVFLARSKEPLPVGTTVVVMEVHGPRSVVVAPFSDPLDDLLQL